MADDLPSPSKGVYLYFEFIALGFVLEAVVDLLHGGPWWRWSASLFVAAPLFLWIGIKGPSVKTNLELRLPWVRLRRELQAALGQIEELKKTQRPSMWEVISGEHSQSSRQPFYGRNLGFRLEAAQYAAHGDEPINVMDKVRQRVSDGHADVPPKWQLLVGPRYPEDDPHPYMEKYLTVTFSVTDREDGGQILLPHALFFKTLDKLALQLKQLDKEDTGHKVEYLDGTSWMTTLPSLEKHA